MPTLEARDRAADKDLVPRRVRGDRGFGLIELLAAMTMLNVGILAIVAAFSSGTVAIKRASRISTATALADQQMELYRALTYGAIALNNTAVGAADATYTSDSALAGNSQTSSYDLTQTVAVPSATNCSPSPPTPSCSPTQTVVGPDRITYRVDSYVTWYCSLGTLAGTVAIPSCTPPAGGTGVRPTKLVTVVVRDGTTLSQTWARQASTFDQSTG